MIAYFFSFSLSLFSLSIPIFRYILWKNNTNPESNFFYSELKIIFLLYSSFLTKSWIWCVFPPCFHFQWTFVKTQSELKWINNTQIYLLKNIKVLNSISKKSSLSVCPLLPYVQRSPGVTKWRLLRLFLPRSIIPGRHIQHCVQRQLLHPPLPPPPLPPSLPPTPPLASSTIGRQPSRRYLPV